MRFNDKGRFQKHENVFWYLSLGFFDYMLRLCCLQPIDAIFMGEGKVGYASVLCRATPTMVKRGEDALMERALDHSIEFIEMRNEMRARPGSSISTRKRNKGQICLTDWISRPTHLDPQKSQDTRLLLLTDME